MRLRLQPCAAFPSQPWLGGSASACAALTSPRAAAHLPPQPRQPSLSLVQSSQLCQPTLSRRSSTFYLCLALNLTLALTRSTFYLCKQKSEGFQACELSVDFTQHYGENVYVCRA